MHCFFFLKLGVLKYKVLGSICNTTCAFQKLLFMNENDLRVIQVLGCDFFFFIPMPILILKNYLEFARWNSEESLVEMHNKFVDYLVGRIKSKIDFLK